MPEPRRSFAYWPCAIDAFLPCALHMPVLDFRASPLSHHSFWSS